MHISLAFFSMRFNLQLGATVVAFALPVCAQGATVIDDFDVSAVTNLHYSGNIPADGVMTGIFLTLGQSFQVDTNVADFWSICPMSSCLVNADGIAFSTGFSFSKLSDQGQTFNSGTLVGTIGNSQFFEIGSSFDGVAIADGQLKLYMWDYSNEENSGSVFSRVSYDDAPQTTSPVPLPASLPIMITVLGSLTLLRRSRWHGGKDRS